MTKIFLWFNVAPPSKKDRVAFERLGIALEWQDGLAAMWVGGHLYDQAFDVLQEIVRDNNYKGIVAPTLPAPLISNAQSSFISAVLHFRNNEEAYVNATSIWSQWDGEWQIATWMSPRWYGEHS